MKTWQHRRAKDTSLQCFAWRMQHPQLSDLLITMHVPNVQYLAVLGGNGSAAKRTEPCDQLLVQCYLR